ncbi:MAG: benzoate/H(+) symporter BenE family transporter [Chloroflexota bacterium]|nr:benzoate/H(+) symporter BenE family transporter [Chloroflexota bacterium]
MGVALVAYLLSRQRPGGKVPPVLLALVGGIVAAALTGDVEPLPEGWSALAFEAERPVLSVRGIVSVVPVVVVLVAMQANLTAVVYLRSNEFQPPARAIDIATGLATTLGAMFGQVPVCMAALMTPLTAGPEAGEREVRQWSVYASGLVLVLIGLGSGVAAAIPTMIHYRCCWRWRAWRSLACSGMRSGRLRVARCGLGPGGLCGRLL